MRKISAHEVIHFHGRIIDVRSPAEYAAERLPRAENVPLDRLAEVAAGWDRGEPLLVMCKSGVRSTDGARRLAEMGFARVDMLDGGIDACRKAGVEILGKGGHMPIVRQVMLVAGLMLLAGLVLSSLVSPWFILLTWFVTLGLINAGLTGWCPMARILEKMPWNAAPDQSRDCCAA